VSDLTSWRSEQPPPYEPLDQAPATQRLRAVESSPSDIDPLEPPIAQRRRSGPRSRLLAIVLTIAIVAAIAGWIAGSKLTSNDDARRRSQAPSPSLITAPVERRVLTNTLVLRGSLTFERSMPIVIRGGAESTPIVTLPPKAPGSEVQEGDVFMEVSGRPVVVMTGVVPAFRPIAAGATGADVEQFERGLERLGFSPGVVDSVVDASTLAAVTAFYQHLGYPVIEPSAEQRARYENAAAAAAAAKHDLVGAEAAVTAATRPPTASERLANDNAVADARAAADLAIGAANSVGSANAAALAAADEAVTAAQSTKSLADATLADASAGRTNPTTGEPYTTVEVDALRSAATVAATSLTARQRERTATKEAGEEQAAAKLAAVDAAQRLLTLATTQRDAALHPPADTGAAAALALAHAASDDADRRLADASAGLQPNVPLGEVLFVPSLPSRIDAVHVVRGDTIDGPVAEISGERQIVTASVAAADRDLVKVGGPVEIQDDAGRTTLSGVIATVGASPIASDSPTSGSNRYTVEATLSQPPTPSELDVLQGASLKLTVPVTSTDGEVLVVPAAALTSDASGTPRVEVEHKGTTRPVEVRTGLSAHGFVEIQGPPTDIGEGDRVVIGQRH